jgi:lysophospholipid acyltransferase (LPLAT)-like uncharacterized protein
MARPRWRTVLFKTITVAVPPVVSVTLYLLSKTLRLRLFGAEDLFARWARGERVIVAFWHNRLLMMPLADPGQPICVMVSAHRDGEIAVRALRRWNIHAVRGSTTRGGARGLLQLLRAHREGFNLAVVPDGPKGPCCSAKPGVIQLARLTGAAVFPVSYAASRVKRLRSWDRLIVPLPFARVAVVIGEPINVPRDADPERIEVLRKTLEKRLNDLNYRAEVHLAA